MVVTHQRRSPISEITEQCHDRDSNPRCESRKSDVLTATPLSHLLTKERYYRLFGVDSLGSTCGADDMGQEVGVFL